MSIIKSLLSSLRNNKRSKGVAIIEAALTLPIVCYLLFFILELMKINLTQTAIETITQEATFDFIANGKITNFGAIIEKHRPPFIPADHIRYCFKFYKPGLAAMCFDAPYGGEAITYPNFNTYSTVTLSDPPSTDTLSDPPSPTLDITTPDTVIDTDMIATAGTAFVLTFSCSYVFSSQFVRMLFNGGVNSEEAASSTYLLWGRGVGIVN